MAGGAADAGVTHDSAVLLVGPVAGARRRRSLSLGAAPPGIVGRLSAATVVSTKPCPTQVPGARVAGPSASSPRGHRL